jgi:uncharacterized membrane protein
VKASVGARQNRGQRGPRDGVGVSEPFGRTNCELLHPVVAVTNEPATGIQDPAAIAAGIARPIQAFTKPTSCSQGQIGQDCDLRLENGAGRRGFGVVVVVRGDRDGPLLRARAGHGRRGRPWLGSGSDSHKLNLTVRTVRDDTCLVGKGPQATKARVVTPDPSRFRMSVDTACEESKAARATLRRLGWGTRREVAVANEPEVAVGRAREGGEAANAMLERLHDPARVLALTDGVFAIIITLLVLEIHVPELSQGHSLNEALGELRPSLVAFVISFVLAGMYWVGHRDLFALIRRTDRGLVWLNILFMLPLCLLPFGAGMIGRYDQEPVALRIYGLVLVTIAIMRVVIWLYATNRPHLLWQRLDDRQRRAGLALNLLPGLVYLLAFLVAKTAPGLSLLIYAGLPVLYFLSITVLRWGRKGNQEYADFT